MALTVDEFLLLLNNKPLFVKVLSHIETYETTCLLND